MTEQQAMRMALEALQLALRCHGVMLLSDPPKDAWKYHGVEAKANKAITALRQALEQQPVSPELATLIDENQRLRAELKFNGSEPADTVDWKDMYQKEKRKSEMWVAKYEKDIGSLEKASPMQQQDEPVAWVNHGENRIARATGWDGYGALYTRPQPAAWVSLTDEEISAVDWKSNETLHDFARAIEAALRSKNT